MTDETNRLLFFISEVKDYGAVYECKRCGNLTATKVEMYRHRTGIITPCFRTRIKQKVRSLFNGILE